jgi:hypothetical protein
VVSKTADLVTGAVQVMEAGTALPTLTIEENC